MRAGAPAGVGPCTLVVYQRRLAKTAATIRKCAFSPNCWGTGGGWGVGWKWAPIGGLQYQTHMQAPRYDVQFLRSEALRSSSSSSSSSRTRQIKECKTANTIAEHIPVEKNMNGNFGLWTVCYPNRHIRAAVGFGFAHYRGCRSGQHVRRRQLLRCTVRSAMARPSSSAIVRRRKQRRRRRQPQQLRR